MPPTPRAERRAATLSSIKECALEQLAERGPEGLSLRHVAREMGMVSSGIYRYYPSRDALLTDLIVDGYRDLAAALRSAPGSVGADALAARGSAVREWAKAQPHRFQLVFGTPIAGYEAPRDTVAAAAEMYGAFLEAAARPARPSRRRTRALSAEALAQAREAIDSLDLDAAPETTARAVGLLAQVIGVVLLELNGQFKGTFDPADAYFGDLVRQGASDVLAD